MSDEAKQIRAFVAQVDAGEIAWNSAKWPEARAAFLAGAEALERVEARRQGYCSGREGAQAHMFDFYTHVCLYCDARKP